MPVEPCRHLNFRGRVERRHEADILALTPGDLVLVHRGTLRSAIIACPDGCGELLTINLDERAGPAWRLYEGRRGMTLYPSVWRDNGCGSHFIVWHDTILWCDRFERDNVEPSFLDNSLVPRVKAALTENFRSSAELATELGEIPWEVGRACKQLVQANVAIEGTGKQRGCFRLSGLNKRA